MVREVDPGTIRFQMRVTWFFVVLGVAAESGAQDPGRPREPSPAAPTPSGTAAPALAPEHEARRMRAAPVDLGRAQFRPGSGLSIGSADRAFLLTTRLRLQVLFSVDDEDGALGNALQLRRARVVFAGNFFGSHNRMKLELALSPRDMAMDSEGVAHRTPVLDWYFDFDHLRDLTLRVGQYKIPFNRQRVISSGDLQLVDRSAAQGEFTLDRDVGVEVRSADFLGLDRLRYYLGVYNGEGRDPFRSRDFGLLYLGRVEVLPMGRFDDYEEADFERSPPRLSLGLAYAYLDRAPGVQGSLGRAPRDGGTTDYHNVAADAVLKMWGLSVLSEFYWRDGTRNPGAAVDGSGAPVPVEAPRNGLGWFAQAGYLFPHTAFEVAARYSLVRQTGGSSLADRDEVGGGVSYYFGQHSFKLQADYFRTWGERGFADGWDRLRVQLQSAF